MATNAVILNTPEAENMAERINVQAATWCHFYWKDTNKGGERFFRKLSERAFNGHLIHEISECTWDAKEQVVTSPRSLSEMSAVYEFESLDWLKNIVQTDRNLKKKHVDPTAAFDFEDDFSVGTIHGKNDDIHTRKVGIDTAAVIDVADDDEVSIISPKTQDGLAARSWIPGCHRLHAPSRRPHHRRYPRRNDRDYTRRSRGTYDPVYHRL